MSNIAQIHDSKDKALQLMKSAISKKAFNPVLIKLDKLTALTDYFAILSGSSARHVKAIADSIMEQTKKIGIAPDSVEGTAIGNWALLDYGDVIVHVFQQPTREFYDLEGLWAEAPRVTLPQELIDEMELAGYDEHDDDFGADDF